LRRACGDAPMKLYSASLEARPTRFHRPRIARAYGDAGSLYTSLPTPMPFRNAETACSCNRRPMCLPQIPIIIVRRCAPGDIVVMADGLRFSAAPPRRRNTDGDFGSVASSKALPAFIPIKWCLAGTHRSSNKASWRSLSACSPWTFPLHGVTRPENTPMEDYVAWSRLIRP